MGPPEAFGKFLTQEREKWSIVVKAAHLQASE